jgi:L-amino acid N-acyltransferase YncA
MTSTALIRIASDSDAAVLRELYRPLVEDTAISLEIELPTVDEFGRWHDVAWFYRPIQEPEEA